MRTIFLDENEIEDVKEGFADLLEEIGDSLFFGVGEDAKKGAKNRKQAENVLLFHTDRFLVPLKVAHVEVNFKESWHRDYGLDTTEAYKYLSDTIMETVIDT